MLILLDRDGVINEDTPTGITRTQDLRLIGGAVEAMARLKKAGFRLAVVTNQSVVGKGLIRARQLEAIHAHLCELLSGYGAHPDAIYACPDHPNRPGRNRKPAPGLLEQALADFSADPARTPMVGDALHDMQAAKAAGCPRHLVTTGKGAATARLPELAALAPVTVHADLGAFADHWLRVGALSVQ